MSYTMFDRLCDRADAVVGGVDDGRIHGLSDEAMDEMWDGLVYIINDFLKLEEFDARIEAHVRVFLEAHYGDN